MCIALRRFGWVTLLAAAMPAAVAAQHSRHYVLAHVRAAEPTPQTTATAQSSPAAPPQVSFTNGMLTISALNSTLADVLNAVKAQTGAKLEIPPSADQERVAVQLGPGHPRDVLSQLLDGSPFDYILLGSAEQPNALTQIILTPHKGGGTMAAAVQRAPQASPPQAAEDESESEPAQETPEALPPPTMQQEPNQPPAEAAPPNGPPAEENRVKTPEQLLQELQQLQKQEQQRRQQQQQNRPPQ